MNSGINPKEKDYELARENTVAMNCHFLVCGIISIAYFVEFLKGDGTLLYVLATIILAMGPVVGEIICYKKQHDTKMIKHFVGIGYAILYTFVMFTTNNHFTFVYVIPMLIAITVYNDFKYSLPIEVGVVIVNVIQLALFFKRGIYTKADMASVEIQFFVIVLICGIQLYVSIVAEKLNQKKLAELKAEHEKTEELLTRIMDKMTQQITESAQKTASLGESMQAMKESMEEVNSGSNDTAEAVQSQLNQTEEIQAMVEQVEKGTENIIDSMNQNKEAIAQGNANVGILVKQAEETVESGKKVTEELSQLDTYMSQMNSILDIINSITSQTSLLALNASIEAARAGEAGRGFAVVASEISQMAQQTKDSTVQISQLIENVSNAIQMVEVSGSMISMIESQNETTEKTAESFTVIEKNSDNVYGHSNELAAYVTKLADANKKIIDSISTISAISEEVAAHARDTLSATESNNVIVEELAALSGQLETLAQELKEQ